MFGRRRGAKARSEYASLSCHIGSRSNQLRLQLLDRQAQPASHNDRVGHLNRNGPRYGMLTLLLFPRIFYFAAVGINY